jgi:tetratricopeptide (TPR) repeat protein
MRDAGVFRVFAGVALLACVATGALAPLSSNDVWIHLTTGRLILEEGEVPRTDRYSFTAAGNRYVAHEWLAATYYAFAERLSGVTGVIVAGKLLPAIALLGALYLAFRAARASPATFLPLSLLVLTLARHRIIVRPELFALLLAVALVWLLLRDRRLARAGGSRRALLFAIPLAALWANLHGSFPIGVVLVLLFAAAGFAESVFWPRDATAVRWRIAAVVAALLVAGWLATLSPTVFGRPAAIAVAVFAALLGADSAAPIFASPAAAQGARTPLTASLRGILPLLGAAAGMTLAVMANPRGAEIYLFPFEFTSGVTAVTQNIEEWKPVLDSPLLRGTPAFATYLSVLAVSGAALALAALRGRLGLLEVMLLVSLGLLPLRHARWMAFFALTTAPALAASIEAARRDRRVNAPGSALRIAVAALLGAFAAAAAAFAIRDVAQAPPDFAARATIAAAALGGILALASGWGLRLPRHASELATAAAASGVALLAVVHGIPEVPGFPRRPVLGFRASEPIHPVALLRRHATGGQLFTEYEWAGYVIHQLHPKVTVFIDSRSEVYGERLLLEYRDVKLSQRAARRALERYDIDLVLSLYDPYPGTVLMNAGVLGAVESDPRWTLLYVDDATVLYARRDPDRTLPPSFRKIRPRQLRPDDPRVADPELEVEVREALALAPHSAFLRTLLAAALHARGRDDEARAELEEAFRWNPRYPGAPQLAGELAAAAGDREAARRWFLRAQHAYPGWSAPSRALAKLGP